MLGGVREVPLPGASDPGEAAMLPGGGTGGLVKLLVTGKPAVAASEDTLPLAEGTGGGGDWYAALGETGELVLASGPCCLAGGEGDNEGEAGEEVEEGVEEAIGGDDEPSPEVFVVAAAAAAARSRAGLLMAGLVLFGAPAGVGARLPAVRLEPAVVAPVLAVLLKPALAAPKFAVAFTAASAADALTVLLKPVAAVSTITVPL